MSVWILLGLVFVAGVIVEKHIDRKIELLGVELAALDDRLLALEDY